MIPRIAAVVEAKTVTGPAKNLIRFASHNRDRLEFRFFAYSRAASEAEAARHSDPFIEAARHAGIPVSIVWERARFDRSVLSRLTEHLAAFAPDVVQTHSVKSHFLLSRAHKAVARPWLAFHHGYTAEDLKMRLYNQLDRFSLPRATSVITVCQAFAQDLMRYGIPHDRLHVLHNSLDPDWASPHSLAPEAAALRAGFHAPENSFIFLTIGRFSTEKGHSVLLKAASLLRASLASHQPSRSFTLVLVGDGLLRPEMENFVRQKSLEQCVVFAGQKKDVRPYFAACDALVLPSLSEGSPNVLLEAMSAKLPIVATRVGGVPEIVADDESALLVPAKNPVQLANAMRRLLEDPALRSRLVEAATHRLSAAFSPAHYDENLLAIYGNLLARAAV